MVDPGATLLIHLDYMATTKRRINITLPPLEEGALTALAKRDRVPAATKASELLRHALELEEDAVLDALVSTRDTKGAKFVSHKVAWK